MADSSSSSAATAANVSLTSPDRDIDSHGRDYPNTRGGERVPVDSGGVHGTPTYGVGPNAGIDLDADPASPMAAGGPVVPARPAAGDLDEGAKPGPDGAGASSASANRANDGSADAKGDPDADWVRGGPRNLVPGALTTNPDSETTDAAPGALTTNANDPIIGRHVDGDPANVLAGDAGASRSSGVPNFDLPGPLSADARDVRGARVDVGDEGESVPHGRTRPGPSPEQAEAHSPQTQNEPKGPLPPQHQGKPGLESELNPRTRYMAPLYKAAGKLTGKAALITGGDSGIGRAVAVLYAREGADVAIVYLPAEQTDAVETQGAVEAQGRLCVLIPGDLTDAHFCRAAVELTRRELGKIDILVSNAAWQNRKPSIEDVSEEEWDTTFRTNVYAYFRLAKAAVPHMPPGSAIIATSSETGLQGSKELPDYSATKGAINAFTKALAQSLIERGIRVNAVAPGPVWTPLNPADAGMDAQKVSQFGSDAPIGRAAQPEEIAPAYVFLASDPDSSYITGIVLEQMGGTTTAG